MGVESGGGGRVPRSRKISRGRPPRSYAISASFFLTNENFAFSTILKIKWPKSEEKLNFGGRQVWMPMSPSPQTKLRGGAPGSEFRELTLVQSMAVARVGGFRAILSRRPKAN